MKTEPFADTENQIKCPKCGCKQMPSKTAQLYEFHFVYECASCGCNYIIKLVRNAVCVDVDDVKKAFDEKLKQLVAK